MDVRRIKKLIPFALALVLILELLPFAKRDVGAGSITWNLTDDGTLTISGSGDMDKNFTPNGEKPYGNPLSINKVIISDGITSIGKYTFYRCTNLTEVEIADSVKTIGADAFEDCIKLKKITMPISCKPETNTFDGLVAIDDVTLTGSAAGCDYDKTNYTSTPWAKSTASEVNITLDTAITDIGDYTFYNGGSKYVFTDITLTNIESVGVSAFEGDTKVDNVVLDNATKEVLIKSGAFKNCTGLSELQIPVSFVPQRDAFTGLSGLNTVNLGAGTGIGTDHSNSYTATPWYGEGSSITINVADGVTELGPRTFYDCSRMSSISLPDSVVKIGVAAFHTCTEITDFIMPTGVTAISDELFAGCSKLNTLSLPSGIETIGKKSFWRCSALTDFTIPEGVKSAYKNSFYESGLTKATETTPSSLSYEKAAAYHRWYTVPDFRDGYQYDLEGNLTDCFIELPIYLENSDVPPPIKYDTYNVYFDTDGGSKVEHQEIKVEEGTLAYVTKPADPTKHSYDFMGWYEDKSLFVEWDFAKPIPSDDFILYAKWECNHADTKLAHVDGLDDGWDPTCYKKGRHYYYCANPACNKKISDTPVEVDETEHVFEGYIEKAPSTTETGLKRYRCKHCGLIDESRDEVIPMLESAKPLQPTDNPFEYKVNLVVGTQTTCNEIIKKKFDTSYKVVYTTKKIATISSKGVIKGLKAGETIATVTWKSGEEEIEYKFYITVKKPMFSEKMFILRVNQMMSTGFNSEGDTTGLPITFTSTNSNIVAVDSLGNIVGKSYGRAKITAVILGKKVSNVWVYVEDPQLSDTNIEILNGKVTTLKVKGNKRAVEWSTDNPAVARVSFGRITPVKTGITFIHAKVGTYDMKCTVKVDLPVLPDKEKFMAFAEGDPNPRFEMKVLDTEYGSEAEWITKGDYLEITPTVGDTITVIGKKAGTQIISCKINGRKISTVVRVYKPVIKCKDTIKMGKKMTVKMEGGLSTDATWDIENVDGIAVMNYKREFYPRKTGVVYIKLTTAGVTVRKKVTIV